MSTEWFARATLDAEMTTEGRAAPTQNAQKILLTGVTGFVGAFLLDDLLRKTDATIVCLIRAATPELAAERLTATLKKFAIAAPDPRRVVALAGDLSMPLLGLEPRRFDELGSEIDSIVHCGAQVAFLQSYRQLEAPNVKGTIEILKLATLRRIKPLAYVSTMNVALGKRTGRVLESDPIDDTITQLKSGYAQSKWVAEKLVSAAAERGLPVRIFRPGYISGHSHTGVSSTDDNRLALIKLCIELGTAPPLETIFDMAPVDFVSQAIVTLMAGDVKSGTVYHLFNACIVPWSTIVEWMIEAGYSIDRVTHQEWVKRIGTPALDRRRIDKLARQVLAFQAMGEAEWLTSRTGDVDCRNLLNGLKPSGLTCPQLDSAMWHRYLTYLVKEKFLPEPPGPVRFVPPTP